MELEESKSNRITTEIRIRVTLPLTLSAILGVTAILSRVILTFGTNEKFSTALAAYSHQFSAGFERIFLETVPFLLLGALAAAVVEQAFSRNEIRSIYAGGTVQGIAAGLLTALIVPVGEGGSIILARALIKKGAGIPAAAAMMLAAPAVNIPALAAALGSGGASTAFWIRTSVGAGFAVLFALLISLEHEPSRVIQPDCPPLDEEGKDAEVSVGSHGGSRWMKLGVTTAREFLEFVPYVISAALAAAMLQTLLPESWLPPAQGGFMAGAGSAGLWAVLTAYGSLGDVLAVRSSAILWPLAAQTVFLTLGVLVDIKLVMLYSRVLRKKIILYLAALALAAAALAGLIAGIVEAGA